MLKSDNPTAIQSQKWLIQALLNLMSTTDYNEITVSEICRAAGLDRRTFYRNFNSKNDVLEQYVAVLGNEYLANCRTKEQPDRFSATRAFFEFWQTHMNFVKTVVTCGLSDFVFHRFESFIYENRALLSGVQDGTAQNKYALAYRIGGFWHVMLAWVADGAALPPEELARAVTSL